MLNAGDIAILGLRADNPDDFSFVALVDIPGGEIIRFTDNGVFADGTFRANEGILSWTAPVSGITAGTVVSFEGNGDFAVDDSGFALSAAGDQVIAYQDDGGSPKFIYALQSNSTVFQADATNSNTSALPPGLVFGESAFAFGSGPGDGDEIDNIAYAGPTSGTKETLLAAIATASNWQGQNDVNLYVPPPTSFTVDGSGGPTPPAILISEIMYNPASAEDDWEWIEIVNTGSSTVDLSGWVLDDGNASFLSDANIASGSVAAGGSAVFYNADDVTADEFADAWGEGLNLVAVTGWSGNAFNNSGDTVALWSSFADYTGDEATFANALDVVVYDDSGEWPTDDGQASIYLTDLSLDNDLGTSWALSSVGAGTPVGTGRSSNVTAANTGTDVGSPGGDTTEPPDPPAPEVLISAIQGSSTSVTQIGVDDRSALEGEVVTIEAIVTADMQSGDNGVAGSDLSGFFVQEEEADQDDDASTSEGLFIFDDFAEGNPDVQVGDLVQITGTVSEFFGMTQLSADSITVLSSGNDLPEATVVDIGATGTVLDDDGAYVINLEAVEGMLITIPEEMTVNEMFNLDRFGEYRVSADGRPEQFTQNNAPDVAGFDAHLQDVAARSLVLDDAQTSQNPASLEIIDGNNGILDAGDSFRMGDTLTNITGVVNYSFDEFRLQDPTGDYTQTNPRPETPEDVGGNLQVASFNVLNFFTTIDTSGTVTDAGLDPRGADSAEELSRQVEKLSEAIAAIDADILGLVELENSINDVAIETLVMEVNAIVGAGTYDFVATPGLVGTDAITTGLIYKTAEVSVVGSDVLVYEESSAATTLAVASALNDFVSSDDEVGDFQRNRPTVAATFETEDGVELTVAVNHYKSKGDSNLEDTFLDAVNGGAPQADIDALLADPNYDQNDGAGFWNQVRTDAAEELVAWLDGGPDGYGVSDTDNILVVGDLNAYAQEDPVKAFVDAGYVDLVDTFVGEDAYSFVFDGQIGTLDYALASGDLADQATGATEWHINADEADAIDYNLDFGRDPALFNGDTPARNSDHDPVVVGFDLAPDELILLAGNRRSNKLKGTEEDELIVGKGGLLDVLSGGAGADTFYFGKETFNRRFDGDLIKDFDSAEDQIVLANDDYKVRLFDDFAVIRIDGRGLINDRIAVLGEFEDVDDLNISVDTFDLNDYYSV
ncbi:MAG: ExeM/NucH family extracellular endonuclease [Pseudomonadota bacterium]